MLQYGKGVIYLSSNCPECNKEFVPFETGNSILCTDCHTKIRKSVTVKKEDNKKANSAKTPNYVIPPYNPPLNPMSAEELIKSEKYYHSIRFHDKNTRF